MRKTSVLVMTLLLGACADQSAWVNRGWSEEERAAAREQQMTPNLSPAAAAFLYGYMQSQPYSGFSTAPTMRYEHLSPPAPQVQRPTNCTTKQYGSRWVTNCF